MTTTSPTATTRSASTVRVARPTVVRALVRRDYLVGRSYRLAFLLDLLFGIVSLTIYFFISKTFSGVSTANLGGAPSYFAFAAVGVALALVVQAASVRVAQRIREEQLTGAIEILIAQPVTSTELGLGLAGFHFLFAVVRAIAYILVAGFLLHADLGSADWLGFVVVMAATALAMTGVGIALAALILVVRRGELIVAFATLGLTLLGGAYFPISVLPDWIEPLAKILPTTFAFNGVRSALYNGNGWAIPTLELLAFAAVALPASIALLHTGIGLARDRGLLSTP